MIAPGKLTVTERNFQWKKVEAQENALTMLTKVGASVGDSTLQRGTVIYFLLDGRAWAVIKKWDAEEGERIMEVWTIDSNDESREFLRHLQDIKEIEEKALLSDTNISIFE